MVGFVNALEKTNGTQRKLKWKICILDKAGTRQKRKVNELWRQKNSRPWQSCREKNKGRVIESDKKRKLLTLNFQKVGILFLQKAPPARALLLFFGSAQFGSVMGRTSFAQGR